MTAARNGSGTLPLLWLAAGSIGDALMVLALMHELEPLNPGLTGTVFVRRNAGLVRALAERVPSVRVEALNASPRTLIVLFFALLRPWQIMHAWQHGKKGRRFNTVRDVFLRHPRTRLARFSNQAQVTPHDQVAAFDTDKLVIDNFRALARAAGLDTPPDGAPVALPLAARRPAGFASAPGSYVVCHPFGSTSRTTFPPGRVRALLDELAQRYPDLSFVLTAGPDDAAHAHRIALTRERVTVFADLPILELAGVIRDAALYIGVDTGITHLASVLGKKSVVLGNRSNPHWLPYYNPNARVLANAAHCTCDGHKGGDCLVTEDGEERYRCMYEISDEDVLEAVAAALARP